MGKDSGRDHCLHCTYPSPLRTKYNLLNDLALALADIFHAVQGSCTREDIVHFQYRRQRDAIGILAGPAWRERTDADREDTGEPKPRSTTSRIHVRGSR